MYIKNNNLDKNGVFVKIASNPPNGDLDARVSNTRTIMKIVFAIKTLQCPGGAERVLADVANGLSRREHDVIVVSYDGLDANSFYPLDPSVTWIRLALGNPNRSSTLFETLERIFFLRREMAAMRPDITVGFMTSMYIPLGLALLGTGIRMIASEHTTRARYVSRKLERTLLTFVPWLAEAVAVVSQEVLNSHPPALRRQMVVIPDPVQIAVRGRADVAGAEKPRKILLSVGRLVESKGYESLVDAFALVACRAPDWELRIVGDGYLRARLEDRIAARGMTDRIILPGKTRDISGEYQRAQIFVLPSRFESLGLVVLEALAHGLPVVGFAECSGVNKLIQPGHNGILVAGPDRVSALAHALLKIMMDAKQRVSLVPPRFELPVEFRIENVLDKWEENIRRSSKIIAKK